jgi:hypothetical protein
MHWFIMNIRHETDWVMRAKAMHRLPVQFGLSDLGGNGLMED